MIGCLSLPFPAVIDKATAALPELGHDVEAEGDLYHLMESARLPRRDDSHKITNLYS